MVPYISPAPGIRIGLTLEIISFHRLMASDTDAPGVGKMAHSHKAKNGIFLAHLSHWLVVSYCDHWMSVVRRQQLNQMTSL